MNSTNSSKAILFVSTLDISSEVAWGGSEILWSRTALRMTQQGYAVWIAIKHRPKEAPAIGELQAAGCKVIRLGAPGPLPPKASLPRRTRRWLKRKLTPQPESIKDEVAALRQSNPALVVISQGTCVEGLSWMMKCRDAQIPYVVISHAAHDNLVYSDGFADQLEPGITGALRAFFVSEQNLRKVEDFLALKLTNAEVVRNPFNVRYDVKLPWPKENGTFRLAQVARLEPPSKGQDILFHVLKQPKWKARNILVQLYGSGALERHVKRLSDYLCLVNVAFCGVTNDIEAVWCDNHALILPSRSEGLPITLVEAMLCSRPAIVTNVGGNAEVVVDGVTGFIAAAPAVELLDEAMERAWQKRDRWQEMGEAAASHIRKLIPADPVGEFVKCLEQLL
jgi:glycosyltransferase involved in cell wall biosynthesis